MIKHGLIAMSSSAPHAPFTPLRTVEPGQLFRNRPDRDDPYARYADTDGFECFVSAKTILRMAAWGRAAGSNEIIGRLGGRLCTDGQGDYVLIEHASLNRAAVGTPGSVVADCVTQECARKDFEQTCRPLDLNGWWHTHPGNIGLFFSSTDRQNQATWTGSHAIGIVLRPDLDGEIIKVFRGPKCTELKLANPEVSARIRRQAQRAASSNHGSAHCRQCKQIEPTRDAIPETWSHNQLLSHKHVVKPRGLIFFNLCTAATVSLLLAFVLLVQAAFMTICLSRATSALPVVKVVMPAASTGTSGKHQPIAQDPLQESPDDADLLP